MTVKIDDYYPTYTDIEKEKLQEISHLIESVAEKLSVVIKVERKWGQLSFSSTTGTPIRIARFDDNHVALFVHCQTNLVEQLREMFMDSLKFSKSRAIVLNNQEALPVNDLQICIQMALTYRK